MKRTVMATIILMIISGSLYGQDFSAKEIIRKAEEKMRGETSRTSMTMKIIRPSWSRTISLTSWLKGSEYSLTVVKAPDKERGKTFMKRENQLWQWLPSINRMMKMPPSMMSEGWMGSDFSNDDIIKEFSLVKDYNHEIIGSEQISGKECYKIRLNPKEGAAVVWGKILKWITKDEFLQLRTEYYDENENLIKTEEASNIKKLGGRELPSEFVIFPENKEGHKTRMTMENIEFNISFEPRFFSKQNMKKGTRLLQN